jgi:hypothetical protein
MTDPNIPDIIIKYYNDNVKDKDYDDWVELNFFVIENILGSDETSKEEESSEDDTVEEFYNTYMNRGLEIWYKKMIELFPNLTQTIIEQNNKSASESGEDEDRHIYEFPNPVKIVVHVHLKTKFKYIMVGNLINDENLKPIFELLERTQSYDSLSATQITAINNSVLYYERQTPSIKLTFQNAWGNISNDEYMGIKYVGASINYMYDTFKDISDIVYGTCKGDVHMPLIPESCFYYVKIKTDNQYIKNHLLLSTDIENGMNKDIIYQKIYAYLVEINCPTEIIKFLKNEINGYTDDTINNINDFLTYMFDRIDDKLSYKQLGYYYKSRKYENNIYISKTPQDEHSLNMINTSISDKVIYKNNPSQIIAELPLTDNILHIIQIKDLVGVLETYANFKINDKFITNYLAYYYPQIRTVQQLKKLLIPANKAGKTAKVQIDKKIVEKIIKVNNRETLSSKIHSHITSNRLFNYKSYNKLYIDITSFIKRANAIPPLDLLYIFNTIDLNNNDIINENYSTVMASYLDPVSNKTIYKIHSPTWDELNLLEETAKMNEKSNNSHIKDIMLRLIKYNKISVSIDEVKYLPTKPKGLLYKFNLGFYISRFNEIYSGVIENILEIGSYKKIYEVNIGHKNLGILHQCILNKEDKIYKKGDRIQFVPFEALSVRTFTIIIDTNYKVNMWVYGSRLQSISPDDLDSYINVVNSFLRYINDMTINSRRYLQLFPKSDMLHLSGMNSYINSATYINDISIHNTMSISCPDGTCSNQIGISDLNRLRTIIRTMFHLYFDIEDELKNGAVVYYKKGGKGKIEKAKFLGMESDKYRIEIINEGKRKKTRQIICFRHELITDLKNEYKIKLTYKKVSNYVYLTSMEKKMKYYAERIMSNQNVIMNLMNENSNLDEISANLMFNDFLKKYRSILHKNIGINVILDFSKFNSVDDIEHLDIYFENIKNIVYIPFIQKILQTLLFVFYDFTEEIGLGNIEIAENTVSEVSDSEQDSELDSEEDIFGDFDEDQYEDEDDNKPTRLKGMDEYNYLLSHIKELNTSNDLLSRLNEYESKISTTGYTSTCTNRYPLVLNKTEVYAILNRENTINDINKRKIQTAKHEVNIRINEDVYIENNNNYSLVTVKDVNNNNTLDYIIGPKRSVLSSHTQLKSQTRQIDETNISLDRVRQQVYYMDNVYVDTNKLGSNDNIDLLVHSIVKNVMFKFQQNHPTLGNFLKKKVAISQENVPGKEGNICYLIGILENQTTKQDTRKYTIYYSKDTSLKSYMEKDTIEPIYIMEYKCNNKTHITDPTQSKSQSINVYDFMENEVSKLNNYTNLLYMLSPFDQEKHNLIKRKTQKYDTGYKYYICDRNSFYKFDYINSLGYVTDNVGKCLNCCEVNYDGKLIDGKNTDNICRSIVLNDNYYFCPKIIDLNTWITLDVKDPQLKFMNPLNKSFIPKPNANETDWYKSNRNTDITTYDPVYQNENNDQLYHLTTSRNSTNKTLFIRDKAKRAHIYPHIQSRSKLPCCFQKPQRFKQDEIITSNYVSSWGYSLDYRRKGLLPGGSDDFFVNSMSLQTGKMIQGGFYRYGSITEGGNSFISCFYEAVNSSVSTKKPDLKQLMQDLVNNKDVSQKLFSVLNKGTMGYSFKNEHPQISSFQIYCKYLLSDNNKHHKYLYDLFIQPTTLAYFKDVFNVKTKNKSTKNNVNFNIIIFDFITKNKEIRASLIKYFNGRNESVTEEYISSLISNNSISELKKKLKAQYGVTPQINSDTVRSNEYETRLICPTFCYIDSSVQFNKNKNIFMIKNRNLYELIIFQDNHTVKLHPSINDINNMKIKGKDKLTIKILKKTYKNIFRNVYDKCLYIRDSVYPLDKTHLQKGIRKKGLSVCLNFEQTISYIHIFKQISQYNELLSLEDGSKIKLTKAKTKNRNEQGEGDVVYLYDNYSHIIGVYFNGFITPIFPSPYNKNIKEKYNLTIASYYDARFKQLRFKNALDVCIYLENISTLIQVGMGKEINLIRQICDNIAYKPKICITPQDEHIIDSIIVGTNQSIICEKTDVRENSGMKLFSRYEFIRASSWEMEKQTYDRTIRNKEFMQTHGKYEFIHPHLTSTLFEFEKLASQLAFIRYRYVEENELITAIKLEFLNEGDFKGDIENDLNNSDNITEFLLYLPYGVDKTSDITDLLPEDKIVKMSRKDISNTIKNQSYLDTYNNIITLWMRTNQSLMLRPIDYYMRPKQINDKLVSGFILENGSYILFSESILLTDIMNEQMNLKKTFNPFKEFQLNKLNTKNVNSYNNHIIQKLHNGKVLYQLFLREFSLALQLEDIGYLQQRNIPYQRGDNVLIKVNKQWKLGIILERVDVSNYSIIYKDTEQLNNELGTVRKQDEIYVPLKTLILNVLNKNIISLKDKFLELKHIFKNTYHKQKRLDKTNRYIQSIFREWFDIVANNTDIRRTHVKHTNDLNNMVCSKHTSEKSCSSSNFCKWNLKSPELSAFYKFQNLIVKNYEYNLKLNILKYYYPDEDDEHNRPLRFLEDFYGYIDIKNDILQRYDRSIPVTFIYNVLFQFDLLRSTSKLKPIFSINNIINPQYRKRFKREDTYISEFTNEHAVDVYKSFVVRILTDKKVGFVKQTKLDGIYYDKIHQTTQGREQIQIKKRIVNEIKNIVAVYENSYIYDFINTYLKEYGMEVSSNIQIFIQKIWNNVLIDKEALVNSVKQSVYIEHTTDMSNYKCKLELYEREYEQFLNMMIEDMIRNSTRTVEILTNTFNVYNKENPFTLHDHEILFTNDDVNRLLRSNVIQIELNQFINNVNFFDISYTNHVYSKTSEQNSINLSDNQTTRGYTLNNQIYTDVSFKIFKVNAGKPRNRLSYLNTEGQLISYDKLVDIQERLIQLNDSENTGLLGDKVTLKHTHFEINT